MTNDGGPAFPNPALADENCQFQTDVTGLTARDYFAASALPQAVEDYGRKDHTGTNSVLPHAAKPIGTREEIIARQAYRYADAMIRARATK